MSTTTKIRKWGVALAISGAASLAIGQDVVVDQFGTEYLPEALPSGVADVSAAYGTGDEGEAVISRDGGRIYLEPQESALSNEPLVDILDGIVLVPTPGDVIPAGIPGVRGIWHDLEDFPPKAGNALNAYIGGPISLASLDQMVRDTIKAYRSSDRPVVDVLVPEQDITSGVVQLVVVEGRLSTVRVAGATREEEAYLRSQISADKGDVLRSSDLMRDLAWMNRSPYRRVDMVYAPGFEFGTTDLILRTNEIDPFSAYWGYENSGNEL
ncbi:MAG: POTRA domain-containing protein, partial [Planctomycetota bacterium]